MFIKRSAGCTIYEMMTFRKAWDDIKDDSLTLKKEFELINDVVIYG